MPPLGCDLALAVDALLEPRCDRGLEAKAAFVLRVLAEAKGSWLALDREERDGLRECVRAVLLLNSLCVRGWEGAGAWILCRASRKLPTSIRGAAATPV